MILPFVREIFADVKKSAAFVRVVTQVKGGAGRIRVSGLAPTGKALFFPLLHGATARPLIVVVSDSRALYDLLPVVRAMGELPGAVAPEAVVDLPTMCCHSRTFPRILRSRKPEPPRCGRWSPERPAW